MGLELYIVDVDEENLDDFINICIPEGFRDDERFIRGYKEKVVWCKAMFNLFGSIGKLAYVGGGAVGMIQYIPIPHEKLYKITCIFVHDERYLRRGIGRRLLEEVILEARKPRSYFGGDSADALVTRAFEVEGFYSQLEFFRRMGFKNVDPSDPYLLYYPLKEGYILRREVMEYTPLEEDCGEALIFTSPSCPFSIYFSERIRELIGEVSRDYPVRVINEFREPLEVKRRGVVPFCIVNGHPIKTFFTNRERFKREVREAMLDECGYNRSGP